jgi:hypothetical protein
MSELNSKEAEEFASALKRVADDLQKTDKAKSTAERTIRSVLSEALNNVVKKSDGRKRRRSKKRRSKRRRSKRRM